MLNFTKSNLKITPMCYFSCIRVATIPQIWPQTAEVGTNSGHQKVFTEDNPTGIVAK